MITLSENELQELSNAIEEYLYSELKSGMVAGCECGCGGDTADYDSLEESLAEATATIQKYFIIGE